MTHTFVERGEKGRAMHAGYVLCAQSSLVKVYADRPKPEAPRSSCAVIRESEINQGPSGLTYGVSERGRAMHTGKVLCAQSSLVKMYDS